MAGAAINRISRDLDRIYEALVDNKTSTLPPRLRDHVRKHVRGDRAVELSRHVEYIHRNRGRMRYASVIGRGLPIGSGVTEGACKSMVTMRCKRSGQRWRDHGISACLSLRALYLNERLKPCLDYVRVSYMREVTPMN